MAKQNPFAIEIDEVNPVDKGDSPDVLYINESKQLLATVSFRYGDLYVNEAVLILKNNLPNYGEVVYAQAAQTRVGEVWSARTDALEEEIYEKAMIAYHNYLSSNTVKNKTVAHKPAQQKSNSGLSKAVQAFIEDCHHG